MGLRMPRLVAFATALVVVIAAARPARAGDEALYECDKAKGKFAVSLRPELELKDLVAWAMGFSCKKFLYASSIAGRSAKVTIISPGTLSASESWALFETALAAMGLAAVSKGSAIEIVETAKTKAEALAILKTFPDGGAEVVRLILRPQHASVEDLRAALDLVKSENGNVTALPSLHALLITDRAGHVARMKTLVGELDRPASDAGIFAIPLAHVEAESVASTVTKLLGKGATIEVVADARTNALFVSGTAAEYARVAALAQALDVDTGDGAQVHVIKLHHARAKEVATSLGPLIGGAGAGKEGATMGEVKVAADEASNALLVLASAHDVGVLREVVAAMDQPRRQVYLEALVLEVEATNSRDLGVAWHGGTVDSSGNTWLGGLSGESLTSVITDASKLPTGAGILGGVLGVPLDTTELLGTSIPSLGLLLQANQFSSRLDVLSSPHILTVDNQKATISVGTNIPYKSTQGATSAAGIVTPPSIERQKVALTLEITPHVAPSEDGGGHVIRLDLHLDSSQLGTDADSDLGPTWKERMLETSVVLRDEETVVLGGLVDERIEEEVNGVPFLSSIPVLGALFRQTHKRRVKSNLLVILTPHLIDDSVAGREILARRMRERDEFLRATDDLERRVLEPEVDYRKKRGLLAEIDAQVERIEQEKARLERAPAATVKAGRIDGAQE
jgi:general secretion pathway protein D